MKMHYQIELNSDTHQVSGATKHFNGVDRISGIANLQISQFEGDAEFYLLYLDENLKELTDTLHSSVQEAMEQAELEFGVSHKEWQKLI